MPYDPTFPGNGTALRAVELRDQFNAVHTEATTPETDPVFAAAEAALLVPGDKAKLDSAVQPGTDILQLNPAPGTGTFKFLVTDSGGGTTLEFVGPDSLDASDLAYSAGNAADWPGGVPANPGAALDALAGRSVLAAPVAPPALANSQLGFSVDEAGNNLVITVKYSDGTTKSATVPLV